MAIDVTKTLRKALAALEAENGKDLAPDREHPSGAGRRKP
jgi:hypothetical protein